jgi:Tol biopolymer transport system component/DNA-binding winged helix-turn-helix (wHTH) protein
LLKEDQPVTITRRSVETLLVLVENAGQVVSKEELLTAIWPDRVVDEANLTQNIAMVRRALSAERGTPAFIETFPGRGYRLIGPVIVEELATGNLIAETLSEEIAANGSVLDSSFSLLATEPTPSQTQTQTGSRTGLRLVAVAASVVAVAAIGWILLQRKSGPTSAEFHIAPLTRLSGKEWQPAISPDGKKVAFLWDQGDGQPVSLCVQSVDESSPRQIARGSGQYSSPAWSPDQRALAFLKIGHDSTDVMTISLESGDERLIARFIPPGYGLQRRLLDWSPDGQWLVVSHSEAPDKPNGLYLVSVATGEKRRLTTPETMVGGDLDPRFSPDSRTVTFIRDIHRSHQEIFSISINSEDKALKQLTADAKQISGHDWMNDGRQIVFASNRGGEFRLWRMIADAASSDRNPQSIGIYGEFPVELSLARKNDSLVYSVQQQDRNIWRLDLKEKRWTRIVASSAQDASPQYSPAGDKICFRSDRSGDEQLWVSDADGANQRQITKTALYPSVGHWSPDGRQIAFNNARTGELHLASLSDDSSWTIKPFGANGVHPVFSPDGKWIYAGTQSKILRFPAAGGTSSEIANVGGFSLGISADGRFVYFMREVNDTALWRVNTETGELSKAVDGLVQRCTSCWSLADDGIYFLGNSRESFDAQIVYFQDFATGHRREILRYPEPLSPVGSGPFSLSPDLRSLLCVRVDPSNSDILRVEPFR